MPDKKLTPMMELIEDIDKLLTDPEIQKDPLKYKAINVIKNKAIQLKEKEHQMVIDAAIFAYKDMCCLVDGISDADLIEMKKDAEQYYTQTYKSHGIN